MESIFVMVHLLVFLEGKLGLLTTQIVIEQWTISIADGAESENNIKIEEKSSYIG